MKAYTFGLLIGAVLFLQGCFSEDYSDSNRFIQLNLTDALVFENNGNYVVGDTIYFELNFSRYLREEGFSNLLDIYKSTDSEVFSYPFSLQKFSAISDTYVRTDIASQFIFAEKGELDGFSGINAQLSETQDMYESRVGLILAEAGDFRLDFEFLYIYSRGDFDKVSIEIEHRFTTILPEDFEFSVSE